MLDRLGSGVVLHTQPESELIREVGLLEIMREDYRRHWCDWTWPGLQSLWVHRIGVYGKTLPRPWRWFFTIFHGFAHVFCRNVYGIEIERTVQLGRRMRIAHQSGIVIHKFARFGDDCVVHHGVTFGIGHDWEKGKGPVIGNNVSVGIGTVVLGNINIGDNVKIGPNCVVTNDVPPDRILFLSAPRVMPNTTETPARQAV